MEYDDESGCPVSHQYEIDSNTGKQKCFIHYQCPSGGNAHLFVDTGFGIDCGSIIVTTEPKVVHDSTRCLRILLQNNGPSNKTVFIGDEFNQTISIEKGKSIWIGIIDPSKLYIKTNSGTQTIAYLIIM